MRGAQIVGAVEQFLTGLDATHAFIFSRVPRMVGALRGENAGISGGSGVGVWAGAIYTPFDPDAVEAQIGRIFACTGLELG